MHAHSRKQIHTNLAKTIAFKIVIIIIIAKITIAK